MAPQLQRFTAKICGRFNFNKCWLTIFFPLFTLPCQRASNVKGLLQKSKQEGHGWIILSHTMPSAAFSHPVFVLKEADSLSRRMFLWWFKSTQGRFLFLFWVQGLSDKSSLNHCLLTCLTYLLQPPNKACRSCSDVAQNLAFIYWQLGLNWV